MTEFFSDGFESGDFSAWTGTSGSPLIVTSPVHSGSYAARLAISNVQKTLASNYNTLYCRVYWQCTALPNADAGDRIITLFDSGGTKHLDAGFQYGYGAGRTYHFWLNVDGSEAGYDFTPSLNQWYCIEVIFDNVADVHKLWLNGALVMTLNRATSATINKVYVGAYQPFGTWSGYRYYDDVVVSDSYIGPIVLSVLVSDSLSSSDVALRDKPAVIIAENVDALDLTFNDKFLQASDVICIGDTAVISKLLVVNDSVSLVEVVEQGIGGMRTRLFLSLGDLAIQLTGN